MRYKRQIPSSEGAEIKHRDGILACDFFSCFDITSGKISKGFAAFFGNIQAIF